MSNELEGWIAEFFAAREAAPALTPAAFLTRHRDAPPGLAEALATAVEVAGMLRGPDASPQTQIGPYALVRELGRGAMGVVYEVDRGGERFALKLLPPWGAASEHAQARFTREAHALRRLDHPGLVRVRDAGGDASAPWLVMDLVPGTSLATASMPMPPAAAANLVAALADATAAAHATGVVHRDIKPANVLLRADGSPVLVDFGLAGLAGDAGLTGTGDVIGTPRYMSPEQAAGARGDAASDIYALGLVLYELVVGEPARASVDREQVLRAARRGAIPPLARVRPAVPAGLAAIVAQATAHHAHRRYRTAADLAADLRRFAAGEPVRARPPAAPARLLDAARARPRLAAGLALTAMAAIALGAFWSQRRAQALRIVAQQTDLALAAWLVGADAAARAAAQRGVQAAADPLLHGLLAALSPRPIAEGDAWGAAVLALRRHPTAAAAAWQSLPHHSAAALRAYALACAGAGDEAACAVDKLRAAPRTLCGVLALSEVLARTGEVEPALAVLSAGADDDAAAAFVLATARARLALRLGAVGLGVRAARDAARLHTGETRTLTGVFVDLLEAAPERAAVRAELAELIRDDPGDVEPRFALAYSLDVDHDVAAAAAEYGRVVELAPEHARALVCLAHLRNGADRDSCAACARAFAAQPHLIDGTAGALALRALAAAGTRESAVLEAGARVAMAAGASAGLARWLKQVRAAGGGGALAERLEWWQRRCERAGH